MTDNNRDSHERIIVIKISEIYLQVQKFIILSLRKQYIALIICYVLLLLCQVCQCVRYGMNIFNESANYWAVFQIDQPQYMV